MRSASKTGILISLILYCLPVYSQDLTDFSNGTPFPDGLFCPVTPEVRSMVRYGGDASVNLYTGAAKYDISLYTYSDRYFSIPITLSYNADGYKPSLPLYTAGYGWMVNVGGVITREVRGLPDEARSREYADRLRENGELADVYRIAGATGNGPSLLKRMLADYYRRTTVNVDGYGFRTQKRGQHLKSIDYAYSGEIGREYMLIQRYVDLAYGAVETEPDIYHFNFMGYSGSFTLDETGKPVVLNSSSPAGELSISYKYSLTSPLTTYFTIRTGDGYVYTFGCVITCQSVCAWGSDYSNDNEDVISMWKLSSIVSPVGETVNFVYDKNNPVTRESRMDEVCAEKCKLSSSMGNFDNSKSVTEAGSIGTITNIVTDFPLSRISIDNRVDMRFEYDEIGSITDFRVNNCNGDMVRDCRFVVDKVGCQTLLRSVNVSGEGEYTFTYYGEDAVGAMPKNPTCHVDWYGYYSAGSNLPKGCGHDLSKYGKSLENNRGKYDLESTKCYMLKRVTYPTGGYSEYMYGQNRCTHIYDVKSRYDEFLTGGIRVERIDTFNGDGTLQQTKRYVYMDESGKSSGILYFKPITHYEYRLESSTLTIEREVERSMFGTGGARDPHVGYARVLEEVLVEAGSDGKDSLVCVTENIFNTPKGYRYEEQYTSSDSSPISQDGWSFMVSSLPLSEQEMSRNTLYGGLLKETRVYSGAVDDGNLVKKTVTAQGWYRHDKNNRYKVYEAILGCRYFNREVELVSVRPSRIEYTEYDSQHNPLSVRTVKVGECTEEGRPLVITTTDSRGRTVTIENEYRKDYKAYLTGVTKRIDGKAFSARKYSYTSFAIGSKSALLPSSVSGGIISPSGEVTGYDGKLTIMSYDRYGNPDKVKDALGNVTNYLWGYWGLHLVRKEVRMGDYRLLWQWSYEPLIGMTSQTAPNWMETVYGLDEYGRLTSVIESGGIIGKYEYNIVNF